MSDLVVEVRDGVAVLTLNRPQRRNAYTSAMGAQLNEAYRSLDDDDAVRAIVLTGAGDAFCAGADFTTDPFAAPEDKPAFTASPTNPAAFELRTPVIAAVNGHAIGIGLTIALHADIRIMATNAKYSIAQARRGMIGDCMSHWTVPRLAGTSVAAELLLTGRTFNGDEAVTMGLASRSLPADEVLPAALAVANDIAVNVAPMSAALSKRLLWDSLTHNYSARQVAWLETELHHRVLGTPDAAEGVAAFLERRDPQWTTSVSRDWQPLPAPDPED